MDEKLSVLRQNGEIKTTAAEEALRNSRSELDSLCKAMLEKSVTAGEAERRVRDLESTLAELRLQHAAELEEPIAQFTHLLHSVEKYHAELFAHPTLSS